VERGSLSEFQRHSVCYPPSEDTSGLTVAVGPSCSATHIPGYINAAPQRMKDAGTVFVVSVNDPFV